MKTGNFINGNVKKSIFICLFFEVLGTLLISFGAYMLINLVSHSVVSTILISAAAFAVLTVLFVWGFSRTKNIVKALSGSFDDKNRWYESVLDAAPFPIQVTDNDGKWVFMNKANEDVLVKNGVIHDRASAYGKPCHAKSDGSETENYFNWYGAKCKRQTAVLKDKYGNNSGFVEVITDLTSIMNINDYASYEIIRLADNLDSIAQGNLDIDLEVTPGNQDTEDMRNLFVVINESLKRLKDSISTLDEESNKLAEAGIRGDLNVRGDESKFSGIYQHIIHGVNQLFDSIKQPIDVASEFITLLAQGAAVEPIQNTYSGYYSMLVDNLNSVLASINVLLSESDKMINAMRNGELKIRGDSGILKGSYADIINGFNMTLDAVVKPLEESAEVLKRFAYNDLTVEMSDGYAGKFKELSESINMVRSQFLFTQDALIKLGDGDLSLLEVLKKTGKRSEKDQIIPAIIKTYQTIGNLISETEHLAALVFEGKLDERGDAEKFNGAYRQIIEGLNNTLEVINAPIMEASLTLQKVAQGDLTVSMKGEYRGEYNNIKIALNHAIDQVNMLLGQIQSVTNQVTVGSKQVSDGSQLLSQGATEQASALEELTASIDEISSKTKQNAEFASKASSLAFLANNEAFNGTEKMSQMLKAMNEISESSSNISRINKVIDDIAFQTNILALNAAVEAARAGQYGKGFAVVAEEVRNLAAKSAKAAKETNALIESSLSQIESGSKTAEEASNALTNISESVQKVAELVGTIAMSSNEQATAITQINKGLGRVSDVVKTNSATAEESAASSAELSNQANILEGLVSKFKLNSSALTDGNLD